MLAHAMRRVGRSEIGWARIVQQEKRTDSLAQVVAREKVPHVKTIAHPMRRGTLVHVFDLLDGFHIHLLTGYLGDTSNRVRYSWARSSRVTSKSVSIHFSIAETIAPGRGRLGRLLAGHNRTLATERAPMKGAQCDQ